MADLNKIRNAFPQFEDTSDEELIGQISKMTKTPVEDIYDTLKIAPRGVLNEMGRQFAGGLVSDLPKMAGQALQYLSPETSDAAAAGKRIAERAEARGIGFEPDMRGRGLLGQAGVLGARGLAPVLSVAPLAFVPGGQFVAPAAAATLFGASSAQETYDKILEQTGDKEAATDAARRVGLIQGPLEGVATAVGLRAARPLAAALGAAPKTTAGIAGALTETAVAKPFLKGMGVNLAVQPGTEVAQDVGSSLVEQAYGAAPEDLGEMAKQSALGGFGLTLLLSPLGLGGAVSRSRNAERLTQALYSPEAAPEVREAARLEVMEAARQQGVDPANAEEWLQRQLREEAANIATVQQQEEQTLDSAQETPYADIAYALRDPELSEAMSEPDRTKLFSTLTTLQDVETPAEQRDALLKDANETIGRYVAALQGPEAESDLTQPFGLQRQPVLTTPQPVQEINLAGGLTQVQTNIPDALSAYQAPAPAGREMQRAAAPAPVEGVEGIEAVRPGVFQVAQPLQQVGTFVGPRAPQPVTPVGAPTAVAAALPAAPVAAGVSSTPVTTGAPSGTQASQAKQAKTQRKKAPATPAAAVVEDTAPKNVAEAIKEDNEIDRVLKAVEAEDDKVDKLFASVTGDTKKAPGKPSLPTQVYAAIRNAILNPGKAVVVRKAKSVEKDAAATEKYGAKAKRIADAAVEFAAAYEAYASQNLVRSNEVINRDKTADQAVNARATKLRANAAAVQQALAKLGEAVEGNAKDVEAVVRFVKDRAQGAKKGDGKTVLADITLSRAWTAAKSESFMGEPDLLATTGTEVRQSREATARGVTPQLVDAATEGYATFGNGKPQTGLNGILNYIRAEGTPFEKTLAQAVKLAVAGKAPIKIKFVKDGISKYSPKTNTITINETSSKEVALHEALHGALQWFVYTNPNAAQVDALKVALQRVVNYDGKLPPKAADVQAVLKKTLAGKSETAELDAVLELVSYGNTLNDFRRALQGMESNAPRTFIKFANDVMDAIYALVRRMLGAKQSVASDVMENTFQLLEAARAATQETAPSKGNDLKAEVTSQTSQAVQPGTSVPESNNAIIAGPSNALPSNAQLAQYSKTMFPRFALTEMLFNKMGWADWMSGLDKKAVAPLSNWIQKELPALARGISWVNSHYAMPSDTKAVTAKLLSDMKDNRRGGSALFERAAGYIKNLPIEQSREYLDYMNARFDYLRGTGKEPTFKGSDTLSKTIADQVVENAFKYMTQGAMDQKSRDLILGKKSGSTYIGGIKFTEGFVFPESVKKLASNTFGARNLRALKSERTKDDVTLEAIRTRETVDGDQIIEDKFVGIYNPTPELKARLAAGESIFDVMPDEFISAELLAQKTPLDARGQAMLVDPTFVWDLAKKGKNGYRLTAHYDAAQAYKAKTTTEIANAFQNTMTLLANAYSTYQFADGLNKIGATNVDDNGKVTARDGSSVVYDNLAQLNEALNSEGIGADYKPNKNRSTWTRQIDNSSIINISTNEARADAVQSLFRNRGQWVRVPQNEQVYGAMAGKIVNGSVWAAIQDASDRRPVINVPYAQDVMQFHKASKTVYNPATWGTNVATNFGFAMVDDIPMATIAHAGRLYAAATVPVEMRKKLGLTLTPQEEQLMVKIINSNALLGTFSSTEIKAEIYQAMKSNLDGPERNIGSRLLQLAGLEKSRIQAIEKYAGTGVDKAKRINEGMQEWYAAQDNIFRVASVLNYVGKAAAQGQQVDEALINDGGRHAREAFLDYDIDSKAIRIARQTAFPFISWPYAATKLVGKLAIHKPWKLVNLYAAYAILDGMMSAMAGDDDDELRRAMPEYMRERLLFGLGPNAYVRIPFMGDSENPMYYHLGKYMFPSSLVDSSPQGFAGVDWWPSSLTPTGPYIGTVLSLVGGIDPFTGEKLTPESATSLEAFAKRMQYVQSQFAPNLPFVNAKETEKFLEAVSGRVDKTPNHASLTMARYMGLRMYDFNVDSELEAQDRAAAAIEKDYKMEISKIRRQQERLENPDWEKFYEREAEILERLEKRLAKLRGEEPPEE